MKMWHKLIKKRSNMNNFKFAIILIGVSIGSSGYILSSTPSSNTLEEQPTTLKKSTGTVLVGAETAATTILTELEEDAASYFKEREEKSPFKASSKPGVCRFAGLANQEYRFPECAGDTGDDLKKCCSTKTKNDIDASKMLGSMALPNWMKNDSAFSIVDGFFATPVPTTKKVNIYEIYV